MDLRCVVLTLLINILAGNVLLVLTEESQNAGEDPIISRVASVLLSVLHSTTHILIVASWWALSVALLLMTSILETA